MSKPSRGVRHSKTKSTTEIIECAPLVGTLVWVTLCEFEDRNHIRPLAPYLDSIWQAFTDNTVAKGLSMYSVSVFLQSCAVDFVST